MHACLLYTNIVNEDITLFAVEFAVHCPAIVVLSRVQLTVCLVSTVCDLELSILMHNVGVSIF